MSTALKTRRTRKYTKKMSFPEAVRKALMNNWETMPKRNTHVSVDFKKIDKSLYTMRVFNVIGASNDYSDVEFKYFTINMHVDSKDGIVELTLPDLYRALHAYYAKYSHNYTIPVAHALKLLEMIGISIRDLNNKAIHLPGKHYQPKFYTNCGKFTVVADGPDVSVKPLHDKKFIFGIKCDLNRGYIINSISELINMAAFLVNSEKRYFLAQERLQYTIKGLDA